MPKQFLLFLVFLVLIDPFLWKWNDSFYSAAYQYLDEIFGVIGLLYIVFHFRSLSKNEHRIFFLMILFLFLGLLGTINYKYQTGLFPVSLDAFSCIKCFSVFIYANHKIGGMSYNAKQYVLRYSEVAICVMLFVAFFCALANLGTHFMTDETRKGLPCFTFLCRKSSTFSNMFYLYIFFLVLAYRDFKNKKMMRVLILMAAITWMLTIRSRAILFAVIFISMFYWFVVYGKKLKAKVSSILVVLILAAFFVSDKMETTFSNDAHPRTLLLFYGIKTMKDHFPLGAGFGTYGTDVACKYYSKLYYQYRFQYAYGLNPNDTQFAHDNYWPAIMGEFGIFGAAAVALILVFMYKEMNRMYGNNQINKVLAAFLLLTQILASFPTSIFFQYYTIYLFLFMPLMKGSEKGFLPCQN